MSTIILLSVHNLSSQVIMEVLNALNQNSSSIDSIHVVTTRRSKERIFATLLSEPKGHFLQYCSNYGLIDTAIDIGPHPIHVLRDSQGIEIADISTQADNDKLLIQCLQMTYRYTILQDMNEQFQ